jgi:hypothetical protein
MKTLPVIALVMMIVFSSAPPASGTEIGVHLGARFGVEFITFTGDGGTLPPFADYDPEYLGGGIMGGIVTVEFKEYFALRSGVLYAQTGAEWNWSVPLGGDTTGTGNLYTRQAYFQIPLLAKFTLPNQSRFKPYVYAGPAWMYNTSSELQLEEEDWFANLKQRYYMKFYPEVYNVKKDQLMGIVGLGCDAVMGKVRVSLEGQYMMGFNTVFDDVPNMNAITIDKVAVLKDLTGAGSDFKHSIFSISIGVSYQLK